MTNKTIGRRSMIAGTAGAALATPLLARHGWAQSTYPNKQIRVVVPFAPGGTTDLLGRIAVHPDMPVKTAMEYAEYCKKQGPNKVSFGSPAVGGTGHLAMEYFQSLAGFKVEHVVYRGSSLVLKDLLAGHIPSTMDNLPPYLPHILTGAVRALGVSSGKRWFALPDVPTIAEQGFPGFDAAPWWYVAAPAGTPPEIVKKLSDELVKASKSPDVIKRIRDAGAAELGGSSEDLAKHMTAEYAKWKKVVEAAKLEPQ